MNDYHRASGTKPGLSADSHIFTIKGDVCSLSTSPFVVFGPIFFIFPIKWPFYRSFSISVCSSISLDNTDIHGRMSVTFSMWFIRGMKRIKLLGLFIVMTWLWIKSVNWFSCLSAMIRHYVVMSDIIGHNHDAEMTQFQSLLIVAYAL